MNKDPRRIFLRILAFAAFPVLFCRIFSACAGGDASLIENPQIEDSLIEDLVIEDPQKEEPPKGDPVTEKQEIHPRLIVKSSQELVYNGKPQPVSFHYIGEKVPIVIYYHSPEARKEGREGSSSAPVRAGTYYVRVVIYPGEHEHIPVEEVFVEYRILKQPVKIEAEEFQEAFYNGNPKRIQARADPPVPLSYSYYPNRELMETAQRSVEESALRGNSAPRPITETYRGYRRVERAPIERGIYYVWIYYPGDENHEAAHANVEFTILAPAR